MLSCFRCGSWDSERLACDCPDRQTLFHGDARSVLRELPEAFFDVTLTDPPYSSGGAMRSDRNLATGEKYRRSNVAKINHDFSGDNRDQRSFTLWLSDWMGETLWRTRPGGALLCFIDWRNLSCVIDAVQVAGFVYRAIVPWDKTASSRPNKGWFRSQCEYIIAATAGGLTQGGDAPGIAQVGFFAEPEAEPAGVLRFRVHGKGKLHLTEKPVGLLSAILQTREDWQRVFDPFAGSGTTLEAARELGRQGVGIEASRDYCEIIARRLSQKLMLTGAK